MLQRPTRAVFTLTAVIMLAFLATLAAPARNASALANCDVASFSVDDVELAFLTLINNYRAQNGVGSLTISANLTRAATWHSIDMAEHSFSHTDSSGRTSSQRMTDCGVAAGGTRGENIAAGTSWDTAQEVFDAWRNSSGHNANMLRSSFVQIGIARHYDADSRYRYYWVTDFSSINDGTNLAGTGSGGSAPAPPPPATIVKSAIVSPAPGSTLPGSTVTFEWTAGTGVTEYFLYVGSYRGSNRYFGNTLGTGLKATVNNLPTDGRTIYVRLWTLIGGAWQYVDYTYRAAD